MYKAAGATVASSASRVLGPAIGTPAQFGASRAGWTVGGQPAMIPYMRFISIARFMLVLAAFAVCRAFAADAGLTADFDAAGLRSLRAGDVELLDSGQLQVTKAVLVKDAEKTENADVSKPEVRFDPASRTVQQKFGWGAIDCTYKPEGGRLGLELTIRNVATAPLGEVRVRLLSLSSRNCRKARRGRWAGRMSPTTPTM